MASAGKSSHALLLARSASLLLLLTTAAAATTSTSTSATACSAELETCDGYAACSTCASSAGDENTVSLDDCSARYPDVFLVGSEGSTAGYCESIGAAYCCAFADSDTAVDCMNRDDAAGGTTTATAAQGYWGCLLAQDDCSLEDMPCYGASATTDIPTSAPSPFVAATVSPTENSGSPSASPSGSLKSSPSAAPTDGLAVDATPSPTVAINHDPDPASAIDNAAKSTSLDVDTNASTSGAVIRTAPSSSAVIFARTLGLLVVVAAGLLS